jgi:16S rRNA processing protein RimM
MQSQWRKVGKVKEAHGLRGDLWILIFSKDVSWSEDLTQFGLGPDMENPNPQVFEIQKVKPFKQGLLIKPVEVSDRTEAEKLKGQIFYVPEHLFETDEGDVIYLSEILNFEIWDQTNSCRGLITAFSSNQAQDLLVVSKTEGGTAEIPFVEDFIVEMDYANKKIIMNLPEGLWDLTSL